MSDHLLGEDQATSATPLDLLINAISNSDGDYAFAQTPHPDNHNTLSGQNIDIDGILGDNAHGDRSSRPGGSRYIRRDDDDNAGVRSSIVQAILGQQARSEQPGVVDQGQNATESSISTISVWHPRTGMKSYKSERRMLNPPPTLRVTGPLFPLLTAITLATTADTADSTFELSSQLHRISLTPETSDPLPLANLKGRALKKQQTREQERRMLEAAAKTGFGAALPWERRKQLGRDRDVLTDGLTFPGLWVNDQVEKGKTFQLELRIGQPGVEVAAPVLKKRFERKSSGKTATTSTEEPDPQKALADALTAADLDQVEKPEASNQDAPRDGSAHPAQPGDEPETTSAVQSWATMVSAPLALVSKASARTAKAKSMASCLSIHDTVALYTRLNGQTVRTKYMKAKDGDNPQLTSRAGAWSPFRLEVLERAPPPVLSALSNSRGRYRPVRNDPTTDTLTYGSIIELVDVDNGVRSEPLRVVKVDKNEVRVHLDYGHPISELQRVGFVKVDVEDDIASAASRLYLSAPGARSGGGELIGPDDLSRLTGRVKRQKIAKPKDTVESNVLEDEDVERLVDPSSEREGSALLAPKDQGASLDDHLDPALRQEESQNADKVVTEEPDLPKHTGPSTSEPPRGGSELRSATPEPKVNPRKRKTQRNALAKATLQQEEDGSGSALAWTRVSGKEREIKVTEGIETKMVTAMVDTVDDWMCWTITGVSSFTYSFFSLNNAGPLSDTSHSLGSVPQLLAPPVLYPESDTLDIIVADMPTDSPLDVYVGPVGPLPYTLWKSAAPPYLSCKPTLTREIVPAILLGGDDVPINGRQILSSWPHDTRHVIMVVELPRVDEIVRAMQDIKAQRTGSATGGERQSSSQPPQVDAAPRQADSVEQWVTGDTQDPQGEQPQPSEELTIQEALRNAGDALDIDLNRHDSVLDPFAPDEADLIHPLLRESGATGTEPTSATPAQKDDKEDDASVKVFPPKQETRRTDNMTLPIVFVRKADGVGFGVGTSFAAKELPHREYPQSEWNLELVPS